MTKRTSALLAGAFLLSFFTSSSSAQSGQLYNQAGKLTVPRQMHGTVVLGDHLYVLGGELSGGVGKSHWTPTVESAPIMPDGSLGRFTYNRPLPNARAYISTSTVAVNDVVYVAGGNSNGGDIRHNNVLFSRPRRDGILNEWHESPAFKGNGLACFPAVATPGYLHLIGGLTEGDRVVQSVQSGQISADGGLTRWEDGPPLPKPLYFHNAAALDGKVWVWGGASVYQTPGNMNDRVYSASIRADGTLSRWSEAPTRLPKPFHTATMATAGSYLISFCPRYDEGTERTTDIWYTQLNGGVPGPWNRIATDLPVKLYVTAAPDYRRGNVYIPGGRMRQVKGEISDNVFMFTLSGSAQQQDPSTYARASAQNQTLTYEHHKLIAPDAAPGFLPYFLARDQAAGQKNKPLVVYFTSPDVLPCREQNKVLHSAEFQSLMGLASFAWVETAKYPQMARQLGVYRLPTWVVYNTDGVEMARASQPVTADQLGAILTANTTTTAMAQGQ